MVLLVVPTVAIVFVLVVVVLLVVFLLLLLLLVLLQVTERGCTLVIAAWHLATDPHVFKAVPNSTATRLVSIRFSRFAFALRLAFGWEPKFAHGDVVILEHSPSSQRAANTSSRPQQQSTTNNKDNNKK